MIYCDETEIVRDEVIAFCKIHTYIPQKTAIILWNLFFQTPLRPRKHQFAQLFPKLFGFFFLKTAKMELTQFFSVNSIFRMLPAKKEHCHILCFIHFYLGVFLILIISV